MPLPITVITRLDSASAVDPETAGADGQFDASVESLAVNDTGNEEVSFAAPDTIEDTRGSKVAPFLHRNPANGALEIGNFKSLSFAGIAAECEAVGRYMLKDTGSAANTLEVLAASGQIAAARICAANGSIVITCRSGRVTVSPRRPRPDDKCERLG